MKKNSFARPPSRGAPSVVLATGSGGWKTSYHLNTATSEGIDMALRAGVEVKNFEFIHVWNVPKRFAWEGQTWLLPLGAKFVNAHGDPFMDRYSPILGADTDPHYNVRGMAVEALRGNGPIYFDCSAMNAGDVDLMKPKGGWMQLNYTRLRELGMDFFKEKLEWIPQPMMVLGGIKADFEGRTRVPGLFAAAKARNIEPGVYLGGWSLCSTAVTGYITGESAANHAWACGPVKLDGDAVESAKKALFAPLANTGISPKTCLRSIHKTAFPYDVSILKNEASLQKALHEMERIRDDMVPRMAAKDVHYLMKLIEVRGITLMTELFLRASLMRKESRAGHYRQDYPVRNNTAWLKWIIISQKEGELTLSTEPVPIDRYKVKPTRYYMDNFSFPK